jgi:hypothetical protein
MAEPRFKCGSVLILGYGVKPLPAVLETSVKENILMA